MAVKQLQTGAQGRRREDVVHIDFSGNSDAELIEKITIQDQQALECLYHRYYRRLYWFVSHITGQYGAAGDLVNEVMYVIWDTATEFNAGYNASAWIFGIACNEALKSLVHQTGTRAGAAHGPAVEAGNTGALQQRRQTDDGLLAAMLQLSPPHRTTIELAYRYGMSCQEIASVMGCDEQTVKTHMLEVQEVFE